MMKFFDALATIRITRNIDTDTFTAEWQGESNMIAISNELLANADPRFLKQDGDIVTICQYKMRIFGPGPYPNSVYGLRIDA